MNQDSESHHVKGCLFVFDIRYTMFKMSVCRSLRQKTPFSYCINIQKMRIFMQKQPQNGLFSECSNVKFSVLI